MRRYVIALGILAIVLLFSFLIIEKTIAPSTIPKESDVLSFEDCVAHGYPVMESYPRRCTAREGVTFVEVLSQKITYTNASSGMIVVDSPLPEATVTSTILLTGKARGPWFFEASFPVQILDGNGKTLYQGIAEATSDWMTTEFVPFTATATIPETYTGPLLVILKKDNPSGLPKHDASISFSLNKISEKKNTRNVTLYYYNPKLDQGEGGVLCSEKGLVPVKRTLPLSKTPIQDTLRLLLAGAIAETEKAQGITSEYPLEGFSLTSASLRDGELTLTFNDPLNKTVGGSCRTAILWRQIEATAKQFSEVVSVRFSPEELFQP